MEESSAQRKHCFVSFRDPSRNHIAPIPIFPSFYCDCGRSSANFELSFIYVSALSFFDRAIIVSIDPRGPCCSSCFVLRRRAKELVRKVWKSWFVDSIRSWDLSLLSFVFSLKEKCGRENGKGLQEIDL